MELSVPPHEASESLENLRRRLAVAQCINLHQSLLSTGCMVAEGWATHE